MDIKKEIESALKSYAIKKNKTLSDQEMAHHIAEHLKNSTKKKCDHSGLFESCLHCDATKQDANCKHTWVSHTRFFNGPNTDYCIKCGEDNNIVKTSN